MFHVKQNLLIIDNGNRGYDRGTTTQLKATITITFGLNEIDFGEVPVAQCLVYIYVIYELKSLAQSMLYMNMLDYTNTRTL